MKKYGKPSTALLNQKASFFEENELHLKKQRRIKEEYVKQPKREKCKNCDSTWDGLTDFTKDGIGYFVCNSCSHLNGIYQDTVAFCNAIYTDDSGESYAKNYSSDSKENYNYRVASIYHPKAEFMYTAFKVNGINPDSLKYLDFGSGSGYFVAAMDRLGLKDIKGTEVSDSQVAFGNAMIEKELMKVHKLELTNELLSSTSAQVISMIGVLEHLQDPRAALKAIKSNNNIEYVFISVPTFSLSTFIELLSPNIFHRQLGSSHTHLYTEESLKYMCIRTDAHELDLGLFVFGYTAIDDCQQSDSDRTTARFNLN